MHLVAADTEYYLSAPQQARPPDGRLFTATKVRLLKEACSYCRIRSEGGMEAYVSTHSLWLLDPEEEAIVSGFWRRFREM